MATDLRREHARAFIAYLKIHTRNFQPPLSSVMVVCFGKNPFIILASCLISLRAKDRMTTPICQTLFERVKTPEQLLAIPEQELEQILFSVGFYKTKAATLRAVCQALIERHGALSAIAHGATVEIVPRDAASLVALPGVGPKTANLVLAVAFDIPALCVDVHVHKISNALGWVATKTPEQTEAALRTFLPQDLWLDWNTQLVTVGQNGCFSLRGCGQPCRVRDLGLCP
jgi:endonuclease-3